MRNKMLRKINQFFAKNFGFHIARDYPIRPSARFAVKHFNKPVKIIEVGVEYGINAKAMLENMRVKEMFLVDIKNKVNVLYDYDMIEQDSLIAAKYFDNNNWDYIYLDGDKAYPHILQEMEAYWTKLVPNGILAGHDVCRLKRKDTGITRALCEFCTKHEAYPYIKGSDWWIIKNGISR